MYVTVSEEAWPNHHMFSNVANFAFLESLSKLCRFYVIIMHYHLVKISQSNHKANRSEI